MINWIFWIIVVLVIFYLVAPTQEGFSQVSNWPDSILVQPPMNYVPFKIDYNNKVRKAYQTMRNNQKLAHQKAIWGWNNRLHKRAAQRDYNLENHRVKTYMAAQNPRECL